MNRGLEALVSLELNACQTSDQKEWAYNIIEKELKDFECLDNFFQKIKTKYGIDDLDYLEHICSQYEALKKKEKALEILKNKPHISFDLFDTLDTLEEINDYIEFMYGRNDTSVLTQEEYDLFKEIANGKR